MRYEVSAFSYRPTPKALAERLRHSFSVGARRQLSEDRQIIKSKSHFSRLTTDDSRLTTDNTSQMQGGSQPPDAVPLLRLTTHDSRLTTDDSRLTTHD